MPDALSDVPGLNVVQTGGPGGTTSVFIRGANSNQTKVFIDGIDATDPATGTFNFEHILTWDIDRVEIVRGPQSGLYGADAIGGVVNIITKQGSGPAQFGGSIEGGSFGTFNQNVGVRGSLDRFNYYLDFAHWQSSDTPVTPTDMLPLGRQAQDNAYDNKTLSSRFGINLADNFDIGLVTRYIDTSLLFTGDDFLGPESPEEHRRRPAAIHPRDGASRIVRWRLRSNRRSSPIRNSISAISIRTLRMPWRASSTATA